MFGWMGKILHINLSNGVNEELETMSYADQYLRGRGIASKIYWEKVPPGAKAFGPENCLIFMTGPLVATTTQGA